MRVGIPNFAGRISPVLDAAQQFLVVELENGAELGRRSETIKETDLSQRARRVMDLGVDALICGVLSRHLEAALESEGIQVVARRCGSVEEVLQAFLSGELTEESFLLPGCRARLGAKQRRSTRR